MAKSHVLGALVLAAALPMALADGEPADVPDEQTETLRSSIRSLHRTVEAMADDLRELYRENERLRIRGNVFGGDARSRQEDNELSKLRMARLDARLQSLYSEVAATSYPDDPQQLRWARDRAATYGERADQIDQHIEQRRAAIAARPVAP